jgi:hypothetical protein
VKGGRQEKSEKELAALARLQNNYGFLLNPDSVSGQFEDSRDEKLTQETQLKRDHPPPVSSTKASTGKYIPPQGKDHPIRGDLDRRKGADRRSRSRDRERSSRGNGYSDRTPRDNRGGREQDRRERGDDRPRDRDDRRR